MNIRLLLLATIVGLVSLCAPVLAHPHVWVVMKSQIVYDKAGLMTGIRHVWAFDDVYSAFISQDIKPKWKGAFTREELASVAKENVDSLRDDEYFTQAIINGEKAIFGAPFEYWFEQNNGALTLNFTLPLKSALKLRTMELVIYDPLYYLDFAFPEKEPTALPHVPTSCKLTISKGKDIVAAPGQSAKDAYVKEVDAKGFDWQFANFVNVECP